MAKVGQICDFLLEKYPLALLSDFDKGKNGLQFGSKSADVKKVMITLDTTSKVVEEAINKGCNMVISHHPFLFSPLLNMDYNSPVGKKMLNVFQNELNIFSMHTNFDVSSNGMNEILAEKMGMKNYRIPVEEITPNSFIRVGDIEPCTLKELATLAKTSLNEEAVRVVGDFDKVIKKVAIVGGSGGIFVMDAKRLGCDAIITGEIRHNNAIDAIDYNIGIIEVSHFVEANFKATILKMLEEAFPDVEFMLAESDVNPFKVL